MGVARVVATGRNADALNDLAQLHGDRVRTARMLGEEATDLATIQAAAGAPIDVVFDILPPYAQPMQVLAAVRAVRPGGRISLMGGVGMAGEGDLALPYPWLMRNNITIKGQWMYPRAVVPRLIAMVRSGQIGLAQYRITEFALADVADAIAHAATTSGPFNRTSLRM